MQKRSRMLITTAHGAKWQDGIAYKAGSWPYSSAFRS